MRVMVKFSFPSDPGNEVLRSGKIDKVFQGIMEDLKPEAAYFFPVDGQRGGLFVVNMEENSDLLKVVEPFWFGLNADIEVVPCMSGEDLQKGLGQAMPGIIQKYG